LDKFLRFILIFLTLSFCPVFWDPIITQPVTKEYSEGYYRYYVGEFENKNEANQFVTSLRLKRGLKGAFVAKYINGKREQTHPK